VVLPYEVSDGIWDSVAKWAACFPTSDQKPVDRLAAAVFVNSPNPGARLMAMFSAYFDASGNAVDQPFVIVSGYIASYIQWKFLENAWERVHNQYGVKLPFHAADFMAARTNLQKYEKQRNARADYVAIASQPDQAERFLINLVQLVAVTTNCSVAGVVPMEIYNGVSSLLDLREVVPPYALGARLCIELVRQWQQLFDVQEPIECIFEAGDFEQGKFTKLMIDEGAAAPIYKDKKDFVGLQAADHYAWERVAMRKQMARLSPAEPPPSAAYAFLGVIPKLHLETTTAHLIHVCHIKGIDARTRVQHAK
jgi:hypothetical protein